MSKQFFASLAVLLTVSTPFILAQDTPYLKPPQAILDVLNAPEPPQVSVSPTQDTMLMSTQLRYPPIADVAINAAYGEPMNWIDSHTLLVQLVPAGRGKPPANPAVPKGPHVQESSGNAGPTRTYEDMLQTPHDEALWDYYTTSQLAMV